jgi:hypothetical protein
MENKMNLVDAMNILKSGYCLWVGAGIPLQLSGKSDIRPPQWSQLVEELEKISGINSFDERIACEYPERLGVALNKMGRYPFAQFIRIVILEKLATAILNNAKQSLNTNPKDLPAEFIQIAVLGNLANPIVNFNVETLSSISLAGIPDVEHSLKIFKIPDVDDDFSQGDFDGIETISYKRQVLHPHGAINAYGRCVLGAAEYASLEGTLALKLATHAAFQSNLVIVGMSLNDHYLREQLAEFRQQINKIIWFMSESEHKALSPELKKFAYLKNINIVTFFEWPVFWDAVGKELPQPDRDQLISRYDRLLNLSLNTLGSRMGILVKLHDLGGMRDLNFGVEYAEHLLSALHRGESCDSAIDGYQYTQWNDIITKYLCELKSKLG